MFNKLLIGSSAILISSFTFAQANFEAFRQDVFANLSNLTNIQRGDVYQETSSYESEEMDCKYVSTITKTVLLRNSEQLIMLVDDITEATGTGEYCEGSSSRQINVSADNSIEDMLLLRDLPADATIKSLGKSKYTISFTDEEDGERYTSEIVINLKKDMLTFVESAKIDGENISAILLKKIGHKDITDDYIRGLKDLEVYSELFNPLLTEKVSIHSSKLEGTFGSIFYFDESDEK